MKITLKTLHKATAQQVFDQVAKHLLTQKKRAYDAAQDKCLYRYGKLKCAAGCLMTDKEYKPEMDSASQGGGSWDSLIVSEMVPDVHGGLISALQKVHDQREPSQWRSSLSCVAVDHGLKYDLKKYVK